MAIRPSPDNVQRAIRVERELDAKVLKRFRVADDMTVKDAYLSRTNGAEGHGMKEKKDTRGTARCADCLFGRPVTVVDKDKSGKETARRVAEMPNAPQGVEGRA